MGKFAARTESTWRRFRDFARERWWLFPILYIVGVILNARLGELADAAVAAVNASGLSEDVIRSLIGPLGILAMLIGALVLHAYWDVTHNPRPEWYEDEWSIFDQPAHWDEVQGLIRTVQKEIEAAIARSEPMTGRDIAALRARVDSMEVRANTYGDTWRQPGQFWQDRSRWRPARPTQALPPWAVQLLDRVSFATQWIHQNTPQMPYVEDQGLYPGSGSSGSWDGTRGDDGSWNGEIGADQSWTGELAADQSWDGTTYRVVD